MSTLNVLIAPYETEKTVRLAARDQYTFVVSDRATKVAVRMAFEQLYGIRPISIAMIKTAEKFKSQGDRRKKSSIKKAIITLKKGTKIDLSSFKNA